MIFGMKMGDSNVGDIVMLATYDGDHFKMLMTKKYVDDIFLHVGDILIGHQHHNTPECDVDD